MLQFLLATILFSYFKIL